MFAAWRASYKTDALTPPRARLAGGFPAKAGAPDVDTGAGAVVVVPRAPEPNLTLASSLSSALAMVVQGPCRASPPDRPVRPSVQSSAALRLSAIDAVRKTLLLTFPYGKFGGKRHLRGRNLELTRVLIESIESKAEGRSHRRQAGSRPARAPRARQRVLERRAAYRPPSAVNFPTTFLGQA